MDACQLYEKYPELEHCVPGTARERGVAHGIRTPGGWAGSHPHPGPAPPTLSLPQPRAQLGRKGRLVTAHGWQPGSEDLTLLLLKHPVLMTSPAPTAASSANGPRRPVSLTENTHTWCFTVFSKDSYTLCHWGLKSLMKQVKWNFIILLLQVER